MREASPRFGVRRRVQVSGERVMPETIVWAGEREERERERERESERESQ